MNVAAIEDTADIGALVTAIAHSPIVVPQPPARLAPLPAGFDCVDAAILAWIAAEGCRIGRDLARM